MRKILLFIILAVLFAACEMPPLGGSGFIQWFNSTIFGEKSPNVNPTPNPTQSSSIGDDSTATGAQNAKANAEILHEMIQVIFMREPKDRSEFGNWVDTLNQGASFEGVYHGFMHSSDFKKLEAENPGASPEAIRIFSEELANLESELPTSLPFDDDALPSTGSPVPIMDRHVMAEKYARRFVNASIFTLKSVLGEEALRVIASKNAYREKLALWYSKWVVRTIQRKVDFGIPLRNTADEAFHYKWALQNNEDRIRWEVLNRIHRILNEANKQK